MTAPEKDEVREDQVVEETEAAGTAASEAEDTQAAEQAPEGNDSENEAEDPIEAAKKEAAACKISIFAFMRNGIRIVVA